MPVRLQLWTATRSLVAPRVFATAIHLLLVAACGESASGPDSRIPATVSIAVGDNQSGAAATALPIPVRVRVLADGGEPVANVAVAWDIAAGGGSTSADTTLTDQDGGAEVAWTLGPGVGENILHAAVRGVSPAVFKATAIAGAPAFVLKHGGDSQQAVVGDPLPDSLTVKVTDEHGNALAGVPVQWEAADGEAEHIVQPSSSTTNQEGLSSAKWTLGYPVGEQAVIASAGESTSLRAEFRATSVPRLQKVSGDLQGGVPDYWLPRPLVIQAVDGRGNGVSNREVSWTVTTGGGTLLNTANFQRTDADGYSSAVWRIGTVDTATVIASLPGSTEVEFKFRRATAASGILASSQTWIRSSSPYFLVGDVEIAEGATLTIEPGVEVGSQAISSSSPRIKVWGGVHAVGTEQDSISFRNVVLRASGPGAEIHLDRTVFEGGSPSEAGSSEAASFVLRRSRVFDAGDQIWFVWVQSYRHSITIEQNIFDGAPTLLVYPFPYQSGPVRIAQNSFYDQHAIHINQSADVSVLTVEHNNFYGTGRSIRIPVAAAVSSNVDVNLAHNFWGTADPSVIAGMIYDKNDTLELGRITFDPILTAPAEGAPRKWPPRHLLARDRIGVARGGRFGREISVRSEAQRIRPLLKTCVGRTSPLKQARQNEMRRFRQGPA